MSACKITNGSNNTTLILFYYSSIRSLNKSLFAVCRVKETHEIAEAQQRKNEKLRQAFGISEYFIEGSSFDPERHSKEAAAKAALEATKKYALIPSPPPSSENEETEKVEKQAEASPKSKKHSR